MKKRISLYVFFIALTLPIFSEVQDDTYLNCKGGFNNATNWKVAYVILRESENVLDKEAAVGFSIKDISFYKGDQVKDFAKVKDGWTGEIGMRTFDLSVSDNAYSFSRDDSFYGETGDKVIIGNVITDQGLYVPDYEKFSINRSTLRMSYEIYNRNYQRDYGTARYASFSCKVVTKEEFSSAVLKVIDKRWKKGIKKEGKRLEKIKKEKAKVKPVI